MHKSFYASGFLYHLHSRQILLRKQHSGNEVSHVLFRGKCHKNQDPQLVFQRSLEKTLGVAISAATIRPVYDYIHEDLGEHFIFYVEITDVTLPNYISMYQIGWLPLSKLAKYLMNEQTRHDLLIGERVIRSINEAATRAYS